MTKPAGAPLFVVRNDATAEEVAALTAVLHAAAAAAAPTAAPRSRPEWSAHHRRVRRPHHPGPGGWRSSATPG